MAVRSLAGDGRSAVIRFYWNRWISESVISCDKPLYLNLLLAAYPQWPWRLTGTNSVWKQTRKKTEHKFEPSNSKREFLTSNLTWKNVLVSQAVQRWASDWLLIHLRYQQIRNPRKIIVSLRHQFRILWASKFSFILPISWKRNKKKTVNLLNKFSGVIYVLLPVF